MKIVDLFFYYKIESDTTVTLYNPFEFPLTGRKLRRIKKLIKKQERKDIKHVIILPLKEKIKF